MKYIILSTYCCFIEIKYSCYMERLAKKLTRWFLNRKLYVAISRSQGLPWAVVEASPTWPEDFCPPRSLSSLFQCTEKKTSMITVRDESMAWFDLFCR